MSETLIHYDALEQAAHCLKTVAHPHRLRIIEMLLTRERTVGELANRCEIKSAVASEHLRLLKDRGLLRSRRDGRNIYYAIAEPGLAGILDCVAKRFGERDKDLKPTKSTEL